MFIIFGYAYESIRNIISRSARVRPSG
jgi:hypothetical protein